MSSKNVALNVLVDAKTEYTKQLVDMLTPRIYEGITSLYEDAKLDSEPAKVLVHFQQQLSQIPNWTTDILRGICPNTKKQIVIGSSLVTVVFISHAKVLTSVKFNGIEPEQPIDLKKPKGPQFVHKCYIQTAREFWKNPYLCYDYNLSAIDIQRNFREAHQLISSSITEMIRKLLPVRTILQEYLGTSCEPDPDDDISETVSAAGRRNLKRMVDRDVAASVRWMTNILNIVYNPTDPEQTDKNEDNHHKTDLADDLQIYG